MAASVDEPASDLKYSGNRPASNRPIAATTAMFGEVGLAGEVRGVTQASLRLREAAQMGFRRCIMPQANIGPDLHANRADGDRPNDGDCELLGVRTVGEALDALL